jgi:uridine phosphorylase
MTKTRLKISDSTFNGTRVVTTSIGMGAAAADVAIQANGKILVTGVLSYR